LQEWRQFEAMRRAKGSRAPFTSAAADLMIRELFKLRSQGQDVAAVLNQSVLNGWSGVFPIKSPRAPMQRNGQPAQTKEQRDLEAMRLLGFLAEPRPADNVIEG
jgi:hypothetical protein